MTVKKISIIIWLSALLCVSNLNSLVMSLPIYSILILWVFFCGVISKHTMNLGIVTIIIIFIGSIHERDFGFMYWKIVAFLFLFIFYVGYAEKIAKSYRKEDWFRIIYQCSLVQIFIFIISVALYSIQGNLDFGTLDRFGKTLPPSGYTLIFPAMFWVAGFRFRFLGTVSLFSIMVVFWSAERRLLIPLLAVIFFWLWSRFPDLQRKSVTFLLIGVFCSVGLVSTAEWNIISDLERILASVENYSAMEANREWRFFEFVIFRSQFQSLDLVTMLLGNGLSGAVSLPWEKTLADVTWSDLPLLHNGFLSIIWKAGVLGFLVILISIYKRIGALSKISKVLSHSLINRSAFVSIFLTGVFVMGPIGHTDYFGLCLLAAGSVCHD